MASAKRNIWQALQTALVVALVTLLIWLFAEANTLREQELPLQVRFLPPTADTFVEGALFPVQMMRFKCAAGRMNRVRRLLEDPIEIRLDDDGPDGQTQRSIAMKETLAGCEPLARLGVTILEVRDETATIGVHRLARMTLPIGVDAPRELFLSTPTSDPTEAEVVLPAAVAEAFPDLGLQVVLGDAFLRDYAPKVPHTEPRELALPPDVMARMPDGYSPAIEPRRARITFNLKSQKKIYEPTNLPVWVRLLPKNVGRYVISMDDAAEEFARNVQLEIPSSMEERLDQNPDLIKVYVELTDEDLGETRIQVTPTIDVPPGVDVNTEPDVVTISIERIREPAAAPEPVDAAAPVP